MYHYEIMLVVDGTLTPETANENVKALVALLREFDDFIEKNIWNDVLAYEIKKKKVGHRYIFTFKTDKFAQIEEFKRQSNFNKYVLRVLIMNLEKNYGYKASKNPKKLAIFEHKQQKYQNYLAAKAAALAIEEQGNTVEGGMRRVRDYNNLTTEKTFIKEEVK